MHTKDQDCVAFLQWALPQLRMRWRGFRKVHRQVCKRLRRRLQVLGIGDYNAYIDYLEKHPEEWQTVDSLCRITISRFYRDWGVFDALRDVWMPKLARRAALEDRPFRLWSAGCASGEEPYTLALISEFVLGATIKPLEWQIVATDADAHMLHRARRACYPGGSLKELPPEWVARAFRRRGSEFCLMEDIGQHVTFLEQDVRHQQPTGTFDIILCRYLVGTYYNPALQAETFDRLARRLVPGGLLVLGNNESVPEEVASLRPLNKGLQIYERWEKEVVG